VNGSPVASADANAGPLYDQPFGKYDDPTATTNDEDADAEEVDLPGVSRRPGGPAEAGTWRASAMRDRRACKTPSHSLRGVAPRSAPAHNPSSQ